MEELAVQHLTEQENDENVRDVVHPDDV